MARRKNILFLTHRVPFPPDKGDKIRTFHELQRLAASHHVYCACFVDCREDRVHAAALREWCREVYTVEWSAARARLKAVAALAGKRPITLAAYDDARLRRRLDIWSEAVEFDAVAAFSACMAPYALRVRATRRVLDLCDADSEKWLDYAASTHWPMSCIHAMEGRRLRAYERECMDAFDATIVITPREKALLDPRGEHSKLHVIPNGVDLPASAISRASSREPIISFIGAMDYRPNVSGIGWFVHEVWPRVLASQPRARLMIVGRNPARSVRRLGNRPGVCVTGEVASVRPYLAQSRVVIAPLHIARGMANKVLEAMAHRRPVVAMPDVASCLSAEAGRHLLVARDAAAFGERVIRLCRNDALCDRIAESGYRFVAVNCSWTEAMGRYHSLVVGEEPEAKFARESLTASISRGISRGIRKRALPVSMPPGHAPQEMPGARGDFRYHFSSI